MVLILLCCVIGYGTTLELSKSKIQNPPLFRGQHFAFAFLITAILHWLFNVFLNKKRLIFFEVETRFYNKNVKKAFINVYYNKSYLFTL